MATWQVLQQRVTYLQQVKPCVLAAAGSAQSLREKLAPGDREKLALGEATNKAKLANASEATKRAPLELIQKGRPIACYVDKKAARMPQILLDMGSLTRAHGLHRRWQLQ